MSSIRLVVLLLATLALQACTVYDDEADARIHWVFPGGLDCFSAGIVAIEVRLDGIDVGDRRFASVPCEAGSVDFIDLDKGHYDVLVLGFAPRDPAPFWIFDGALPSRIFGGFNEFTLILEPF